MEYPSSYDFFLRFKSLLDNKGFFLDYILTGASSNLQRITTINANKIIGRKLSEITIEYESELFGLNDIYYNAIPKSRKKFEKYIGKLDKWYSITLFSDEKDYLFIFYSDITRIKNQTKTIVNVNSKYEDEIDKKTLCYKDQLTDLYNGDFFKEELTRLDSSRQLPMTIIMGDLNGLKLINDAFGHGMGDKVLIKSANIMRKCFRKEDIVARVGGDEFVILLPKTQKETAINIIKRMKEECKANPLDFIQISISFGIATKENENEDINEIYKKAESSMYFNKLTESKEAKLSIIKFLMKKLEEMTSENKAHFDRLKDLSMMLAEEVGLSELDKQKLRLLCKYHDIGKIAIPSNILHKKDTLDKDEWEKIRSHSEVGYHIIAASRETLVIDELILMHHERWDGKGYPGLLKGEEIPMTVRIFAIADAYEAMVNDKPYRERMTSTEALTEIKAQGGSQFDPELANTFVKIMSIKKEKAI